MKKAFLLASILFISVISTACITVFKLHCKVYGVSEASCLLLEDDGVSYDFEKGLFNLVTLEAVDKKVKMNRTGKCKLKRYEIKSYEFIN